MQRKDAILFGLISVVLHSVAVLGVLGPLALGQHEKETGAATLRQAVTGHVVMPDGSPAAGAVVVTSAGGQAVTGADGSFALAVELPLGTESLEVTAVADERAGSGSLVANARFVPAGISPQVSVGRLVLTLSPNCHPRWLPTFGEQPGANDRVLVVTVFDDGNGPALYAGGFFDGAGGEKANGVAKWDGSSWSGLGNGLTRIGFAGEFEGEVHALAVYDDGGGSALYAGGLFTLAGGMSVNNIAKWDGSNWSAVGLGVDDTVGALTVYDDGGGPALYAGGGFTTAGVGGANRIARWDGSSWTPLGTGMDGGVGALAVFDDGSGPALYAGGAFRTAGGKAAERIAKWDGSTWSALGSGMNASVFALTVFDDGGGPALYAGGFFFSAGGVTVNGIAKWDGSSWSALGSGVAPLEVGALTVYDDGNGAALYVGGNFTSAGGVTVNRIAKWDGSSWSALGSGMDKSISGMTVLGLTVYDDGGGPALYAGGGFTTAGGVPANRIAKWNGASWSALGGGMNAGVYALAVFDDGGGPALYAAGDFTTAGGINANRIAKWDGSSWSALGGGMSNRVVALTVHDDGSGPALYAGGFFLSAGGMSASRIARWNGSSWSRLGSGLSGTPSDVQALTVYDDGSGPALYAGGSFTSAGGVAANRIARWNGSTWSALGSGMNNSVLSLEVFDDGGGPALYAGGQFKTAGGVAANRIAKWDGASWSALGRGVGSGSDKSVAALAVYDDGSGLALYAGGFFGKWLQRWNGSTWTGLVPGMNDSVQALASWDDGDGPALYAGGRFNASRTKDSFLAKWGCMTKPTAKPRKL